MRAIIDSNQVKEAENYLTNVESRWAPDVMGDIFSAEDVRAVRNKAQDEFFYKLIISKAAYAPLIKTDKEVYIFDHIVDTCYVFDQHAVITRKMPISYHKTENWGKRLLVDKVKEKVYTFFVDYGIFSIVEIDLSSGRLLKTTKLEEHTYPEKIQIWNGFIYYLHRDIDRSGYHKLFRVVIQ